MNVPELRFPEFSGEWNKRKLESVAKVNDGTHFTPNYQKDGIPFYSVDTIVNDAEPKYISLEDHKKLIKRCKPEKGDILLSRISSGTLGKSKLVDWNYDFSIYVSLALIKTGNLVNSRFLNLYFKSEIFQKDLMSKSLLLATPMKINIIDLKKTIVNVPSLEEQKKIASFLSKVEEKIKNLEKKQELWETYKKGIMQQIFSQKLRFKDENGEDYPEWVNIKLGEVSDVRDGTHDSPKYIHNGYPLVTSKNLLKNGKIDFENVNYISKLDYDNINKRSKVNIGDILFGMIGTIGNPVIVKSEQFAIKNVALIKENDILKNSYLFYLLKSAIIHKQFYLLNAGGTQKFVALGLIRNLNVPVPTISEQIKISKFLYDIEKRERIIQKEVDLINKFKKGLLQTMLC